MTVTDQMGRQVQIESPVNRIVSLVPSQTELLFYLGLDSRMVGITRFCIEPAEKTKAVTKVGGTKDFNLDLISDLSPDIIIGNKEENEQSTINVLAERFPVWMSDIETLPQALQMITAIGEIVDRREQAHRLVSHIESNFDKMPKPSSRSVAYFIWRRPWMAAGNSTFIHDLLSRIGLVNVFGNLERYPVLNEEMIQSQSPDYILLSSEPYPFKEKHLEEFGAMCPNSQVLLVDGQMFSWYGSRLEKAPEYFSSLFD